jgi:hypothetical protein
MFHCQNFSADIDCIGNRYLHYELLEELRLYVWVKFISVTLMNPTQTLIVHSHQEVPVTHVS